ncbi:hypothetical protein OK016_28030 [Vibrio chagasii]|nr:hypothetical protein [Vibrio chagasii]
MNLINKSVIATQLSQCISNDINSVVASSGCYFVGETDVALSGLESVIEPNKPLLINYNTSHGDKEIEKFDF